MIVPTNIVITGGVKSHPEQISSEQIKPGHVEWYENHPRVFYVLLHGQIYFVDRDFTDDEEARRTLYLKAASNEVRTLATVENSNFLVPLELVPVN